MKNKSSNEVIITVYSEWKNPRSNEQENKEASQSKNNPNEVLSSSKPRRRHVMKPTQVGYDRRAQLLSHCHELRQSGNEQQIIQRPFITDNNRPRNKRRRWSVSVQNIRSVFSKFSVTTRKMSYEPINTEKYDDAERLWSNIQQSVRKKKAKTSGRKYSEFCTKFKRFLKNISGCRCF